MQPPPVPVDPRASLPAPRPDGKAGRAALQLAALLDRQAVSGNDGHGQAFEDAFSRFLPRCTVEDRARVAERLGAVASVPSGLVHVLARDAIAVAGPFLTASPALTDQDLVAIAAEAGQEHLLAVSRRGRVAAAVADVLIERGERPVWHALVGNAGARLSPSAAAELVERAAGDAVLQDLLAHRPECTGALLARLVGIARDEARREVAGRLAPLSPKRPSRVLVALDLADGIERARRTYEVALGAARALRARRAIGEEDVLGLAEAGETEAALCALAACAGLTVVRTEAVFDAPDPAMLLVVARAQGWSWRTVRALLRLRDPRLAARHHFRRAETVFDGVSAATAGRVLGLLRAQELARASR